MSECSPRYNVYSKIHRALRAHMAETLTALGRSDPADETQLRGTLAQLEGLLDLCASHLKHEDRFMHAAMEARRPGSSHKTASDHLHHVEGIAALRREIERVRAAEAGCRESRLEALYHQFSAFVAENFEHMLVEESYNNAVLWECYSDTEIHEIEQLLVASIPPDENARILGLMVPAISAPEREALLGHIRAVAPREAFDGLLSMLLPRLADADRSRLRAAFA